jgi:predicted hydrocarbon binding protein
VAPYPKRVMTSVYEPGKTLILGVLEISDEPGSLAEVAGILSKSGVNLRQSESYASSIGTNAIWSFIGEVGHDFDLKSIENAFHVSPRVKNCELVKSDSGFLSNTLQFPIETTQGARLMLLSPSLLTSAFAEMKKIFGTGGNTLLYNEGLAAGREYTSSIPRELLALGMDRTLKRDKDPIGIFVSLGWGLLEMVEAPPDKSKIVVAIRENFEAVGMKATGPNCQFVRGFLAGSFSAAVGRMLQCTETECIAAGDPACVFTLT